MQSEEIEIRQKEIKKRRSVYYGCAVITCFSLIGCHGKTHPFIVKAKKK